MTDYIFSIKATLWMMASLAKPASSAPEAAFWALTFLTALIGGLIVGLLTFAKSHDWPTSLLAALGAFGLTALGMHELLGL